MIVLTDAAASHIAEILSRYPNGSGFYLSVKKAGCSGYMYAPEVISETDSSYLRFETKQGVAVFIDQRWKSCLAGTLIDLIQEDLGQKRLIYKNPNAESQCGCGDSFTIKPQ